MISLYRNMKFNQKSEALIGIFIIIMMVFRSPYDHQHPDIQNQIIIIIIIMILLSST